MSEELTISDIKASKKEKYEELIPQIKALVEGEKDLIAVTANIMAALKYGMQFLWVGVYFVKSSSLTLSEIEEKKELILGPFQGPTACLRIAFGKGVCGTCWKEKKVIIVDDVNRFPGHIACSSLSKSEIVLPVFKNNEVVMVLDIDSENIANFDKTDQEYLQQLIALMEQLL